MGDVDLYVGIPTVSFSKLEGRVIEIVYSLHPETDKVEHMDGYWSGINEETLHFVIYGTDERIKDTISAIQAISSDLFVACCEVEN